MSPSTTYTFKTTLIPASNGRLVEQLTYTVTQLLEEYKLTSLVHFCQTGKFLDELDS